MQIQADCQEVYICLLKMIHKAHNDNIAMFRNTDYDRPFYKTLNALLDQNGEPIQGAHGAIFCLQGTNQYYKKKIYFEDSQRLIKSYLGDLAYFMQIQKNQLSKQYFVQYKNLSNLNNENHNTYQIVLQRCDYSLFDFIHKSFKKSEQLNIKISIALQLILAVHELHTNKMIHLDLKPGNVLLKKFKVKITDFQSMFHNDSLRLGFMGTLQYCLKEKMQYFNQIFDNTYKFDIYSLGLTIYQLFEKTLPYGIYEPIQQNSDRGQTNTSSQLVESALQRWAKMLSNNISSELFFSQQTPKEIVSLLTFILGECQNIPSSKQIIQREEFLTLKQKVKDTEYKIIDAQTYQKMESEKKKEQNNRELDKAKREQRDLGQKQEKIKQQKKRKQDQIIKLKLSTMAHNILSKTSRNQHNIAQFFFKADNNYNGLIDRNQFYKLYLMAASNQQMDKNTVNEIFDYLDTDYSNQIDSTELMRLFQGILEMKTIKKIQQIYEQKIKTHLLHHRMANLLSNADKNNNGQIELRELRRLITASYSTKKIKNALNANLDGLQKRSVKKISSNHLLILLHKILPEDVRKKIEEAMKMLAQSKQNTSNN